MEERLQPSGEASAKRNLFTDSTFLGWFGVIFGAVFSVIIYYYSIKAVKPVYTVLSDEIWTNNPVESRIKIFFDSVEVRNVRVATIYFWNASNDFLSKESFSKDKPLSLISSKPVSILEVTELGTSRPELKFSKIYHVDDISGTPSDTNATTFDYVSLEMQGDEGFEENDGGKFAVIYTSKTDCKWRVDARIKGVPQGFTEVEVLLENSRGISSNVFILLLIVLFAYIMYPARFFNTPAAIIKNDKISIAEKIGTLIVWLIYISAFIFISKIIIDQMSKITIPETLLEP